jgi:hypothetical protein
MVGKLHKSWPGGHVCMLVAINFIKSIVFLFGGLHSIITDNGTNFTSKELKNYYESMRIKLNFASSRIHR